MAKRPLNKQLLIISCSDRKKQSQMKMKAFDLYDGVVFRMLKKLHRENKMPMNLELLILSAHHGLLGRDEKISPYDRVMTNDRAAEIKEIVRKQLCSLLNRTKPSEIFCCLGEKYWRCIEDPLQSLRVPIIVAHGRIGEKLSETKQWILSKNRVIERQTYV